MQLNVGSDDYNDPTNCLSTFVDAIRKQVFAHYIQNTTAITFAFCPDARSRARSDDYTRRLFRDKRLQCWFPTICVVTTTTAHIHHNTINRFACMPNRSRSQCQGQRGSVGTHRYTQTTGEWTVFVPNRICSIHSGRLLWPALLYACG